MGLHLESWAEKKSLKADAAEAWVSYATQEGKIRNYWVNGEPDRTEKDS